MIVLWMVGDGGWGWRRMGVGGVEHIGVGVDAWRGERENAWCVDVGVGRSWCGSHG